MSDSPGPAQHTPTEAEHALSLLPVTAANHFRLHFFTAVYRLLHYLYLLAGGDDQRLRETLRRHRVLQDYLDDTLGLMPSGVPWGAGAAWWTDRIARWQRGSNEHLPLRAIGQAGLSPREVTSFMIVGLVEEDSRFGAVIADLQAPLDERRPSLELIGRIARGTSVACDPWSICRPLLQFGLVEAVNPDAPRSERVLRVPEVLWDAARGDAQTATSTWFSLEPHAATRAIEELILPERVRQQVQQTPVLVDDGRVRVVIVRGTRGSDRDLVVSAIARALGRGVMTVESSKLADHVARLGPLCTMTGCMPAMVYELNPGDTADVPDLHGYDGPVAALIGFEGGLRGSTVERAVTLTLPTLDAAGRQRQWQSALNGNSIHDLDTIVERFHLPGGYIRRAASTAVAHAGLEGRRDVTPRDVQHACRSLNHQLLDTLAERLDAAGGWSNLVVTETAHLKLMELQQRCRHRERVLTHLGAAFGSSTNRGVRALYTGPSGTGKTLAAKILAAELGLDLYRVDLAAVVNKYIGETEKNLHRVFSVAEELDVVLLLDEGDALLGGRTEVRSANDRYANLETNYLLQRLEHYQGIVLVTTNLGENIDQAFERRMDVVVEFLPPQAEERLAIWRLHLPAEHDVGDAYLHDVAARCAMNGGQIRNAAMQAALLALDDGGVVGARHLEPAVRSEYRKSGATCPLAAPARAEAQRVGGVEAFFGDGKVR
jgi:hypothetical protein